MTDTVVCTQNATEIFIIYTLYFFFCKKKKTHTLLDAKLLTKKAVYNKLKAKVVDPEYCNSTTTYN